MAVNSGAVATGGILQKCGILLGSRTAIQLTCLNTERLRCGAALDANQQHRSHSA
jgi:hypothetical protein